MTRAFVMGDPQAPFAKVLEVLDRHHLLAGDRLAEDVELVSIGDHFDYDVLDPETAGREGVKLLRWLVSHEPAQVRVVLGNHDASRVMELAPFDDAGFATARQFAREVDAGTRTAAEFRATYPHLPPHGVISRDYASFHAEQRSLVVELLLAGRFQLAVVGALADRGDVLISHAAITERELEMLGLAGVREAHAIAAGLSAHLASAVAAVRPAWQAGTIDQLDLAPLHITGCAGFEGGGLLYHRPSNPATGALFDKARPRRYDPRTLPRGLTQIAGHSGHAKCVFELGDWCTQAARARKHGGVRTLTVHGHHVVYDLVRAGAPLPRARDEHSAELVLIDGELRRVAADEVDLLPLASVG
ncbi:hypothetical protein BH11MYX1_BH11MYX1_12700 [soil metagenome]